jgi:glutathione S-transferase
MLHVWGRKTSSNVQALMWCIGELGLDHERYDIARPAHPALGRYYDRLTSRAAFREHVVVSYEDLRAT